MKLLLLGTLLLAFPSLSIFSKHHGYSWKDEPNKHLDLMKGDKKIVRYVYERMDPEDRANLQTLPPRLPSGRRWLSHQGPGRQVYSSPWNLLRVLEMFGSQCRGEEGPGRHLALQRGVSDSRKSNQISCRWKRSRAYRGNRLAGGRRFDLRNRAKNPFFLAPQGRKPSG